MKDDAAPHSARAKDGGCTRLAESAIGAVDVCACGTWYIHIGAMTLRLQPCAVSELLGLLGHAVAEHSSRRFTDVELAACVSFARPTRGDA